MQSISWEADTYSTVSLLTIPVCSYIILKGDICIHDLLL
jgi:hypothetical protein